MIKLKKSLEPVEPLEPLEPAAAPKQQAATPAATARKPAPAKRTPASRARPVASQPEVPASPAPVGKENQPWNLPLQQPVLPVQKRTLPIKKPKLIRDSFIFPERDYALLDVLKEQALMAGREVKKSELLRAGLAALIAMSNKNLIKTLDKVERIKAPGKAKAGRKSK